MDKSNKQDDQPIDENQMMTIKSIWSEKIKLLVCCISFYQLNVIKWNTEKFSCGHKFHEKYINYWVQSN